MSLLAPIERKDRLTTMTKPGAFPCEGVPSNKIHYMATPGSRNLIVWDVEHAALEGNCTIRYGTMNDFTVLYPVDGSADENGKFPCGR